MKSRVGAQTDWSRGRDAGFPCTALLETSAGGQSKAACSTSAQMGSEPAAVGSEVVPAVVEAAVGAVMESAAGDVVEAVVEDVSETVAELVGRTVAQVVAPFEFFVPKTAAVAVAAAAGVLAWFLPLVSRGG